MAVEVDYYDVLGLGRTASLDEISDAVKKQMRQWRKRTEAADLGVRQEAELRVKQIEDARATLTNAMARQAYDAKLSREGVREAALPVANAGADWVEQARHFLSIGDYHSAAYAAREATQQAGNTAESWYLRSRANSGLDRYEDAWYESQQATQLERGNPEYHFNVGMVAEAMGRLDRAIGAYRSAAQLDAAPMYELAVGGVLLQVGNHREALDTIAKVYQRVPEDETANFYYGMALLEAAENVPEVRGSDSYVVTSPEEITEMRALMLRARELKHRDDEVNQGIASIETYLDSVEKKTFNRNALVSMMGPFAEGGCGAMVLGAIIPFIPLLLIFFGLASMNNGGFLWFLIGVGGLVGEYYLLWQPGWKINRSIHRSR